MCYFHCARGAVLSHTRDGQFRSITGPRAQITNIAAI
jgi:hypothetical protein